MLDWNVVVQKSLVQTTYHGIVMPNNIGLSCPSWQHAESSL
jgi:hypothetical protein